MNDPLTAIDGVAGDRIVNARYRSRKKYVSPGRPCSYGVFVLTRGLFWFAPVAKPFRVEVVIEL
jgi:hypothetical protein